jgi:hypothetical protein
MTVKFGLALKAEGKLCVFAPKEDNMIGGWRKLRQELHNLKLIIT